MTDFITLWRTLDFISEFASGCKQHCCCAADVMLLNKYM